jgi:glycerol-3-phosphate dehydrogenase
LTLYDTLGGLQPSVPRHSHLSKTASLKAFPDLRPEILAGSIRYHDAQVDDARHTLELARTAAAHGVAVTASTRVTEFLHDGERINGAVVHDSLTGHSFPVIAKVVVNATGVWAGVTEQLAGVEDPIRMRPSKGVHLVVPRERIQGSLALITRTPTSVLFVLPWGRSWIIGTTDTLWHEGLSHPVATAADVTYLLEQANNSLSSNLTTDDVIGAYAGLRPLVDHEGQTESEISREHTIRRPRPGLVTIAGGKYTTYRVMAEDTVNALSDDLGDLAPSTSNEVPLIGAAEPAEVFAESRLHPGSRQIDDEHLLRLSHRYGRLTVELLDAVEQNPELAAEMPGGAGTLAVEIVHAATHEGALHVDDVLTRRTRLYLEAGDRGLVAARHAARLIGEVLGWDDQTRSDEVARYQRRVAAELEAQMAPDDPSAAQIRERVQDIRLN